MNPIETIRFILKVVIGVGFAVVIAVGSVNESAVKRQFGSGLPLLTTFWLGLDPGAGIGAGFGVGSII